MPVLSNLEFVGEGPGAFARIEYNDADGHCPVVSEISFDGGDPSPMFPQTLDYSGSVTYATEAGIEPLASGAWANAVARFSDNESDVVELAASNTGIADDGSGQVTVLALLIARNPTGPSASLECAMPAPGHLCVDVFDLRGRLVRTLVDRVVGADSTSLNWDGRDTSGSPVPSGVYFVRASALGRVATKKLLLMR
jgi:hypothetical protein